MQYRCKECRGLMYEEDGFWRCDFCKRSVRAPVMPKPVVSHNLDRKEILAPDAYASEQPEFPIYEHREE